MDQHQFDAALRALQAGTTRRAGLAGALGVLLGGRAGALAGDAAHKRRDANRAQAGTESGTWRYSTKFGTKGHGNSNFYDPSGVFVSADTLTAWVADTGNNRIAVWTRLSTSSTTWSYSTKIGSGLLGFDDKSFYNPTGIFVSADELTAWVADTRNHRISIWTRPNISSTTWSYSTEFGKGNLLTPAGDKNFRNPRGVFVSADTRTAWVADSYNNRISIWTRPNTTSKTWSYSTEFGKGNLFTPAGDKNFNDPRGVFVSADKRTAWVADMRNHRISIWTRPSTSSTTWSYSTQFGTRGSGARNFDWSQGVFVSADTLTAWVADMYNSRISIWTRPNTTSKTWSYSAQFGTYGSGNGNFYRPTGVFVSADALTAWVVDPSNDRISIWTKS
jgi:DNA-binding beta-propeller fold protein YncE